MRVAIAIPHARSGRPVPASELTEILRMCEEAGFDSAWTAESLLGPAHVYDPLMVLGFAAAATTRMRLGVAVLVLGLQQPVRLARAAASLDHLTGGRLDLGVALGVRELPHAAFGVPRSARVERFERSVELLRRLWTEETVTWSWNGLQLEEARVAPKPLQTPLPLWVGGGSDGALRRVARIADGWVASGGADLATFARQRARLREMLDEMGRAPESLPVAKRVYLSVDRALADDQRWFRELYDGWPPPDDVVVRGSVEEVRDQLGLLADVGVDLLLLHPVGEERDQYDVIAEQLLPALR